MEEQVIFSWGANSYGQLGLGHRDDRHSPQQLEGVNFRVKAVTGGGGHTVFISAEGRLLVCGWNQKGQLGLGHREDVSVLTQVTALTEPVDTVACGWDFTLAVTEGGQLFSWGSNAFGQLGVPEVKGHSSTSTPVQSLQGVKIVGVAAGLRHTVALDVSTYGKDMANSMYVTDTGSLWTWGAGKKGQLGRLEAGRCPTVSKLPGRVQLDTDPSIVAVTAGSYHTVALAEDRRVWTWGRADYGQLGRFGDRIALPHSCPQPAELSLLYGVKQLQCGSEHNIAVVDDQVVCWGWNEHGMCGDGGEEDVLVPKVVEALQGNTPVWVSTGAGHTMVGMERENTC
ncbi:SERGEF [Branchiostoma lanceolatum]|uniref:SERGEF protein n=1 Tax=Branchiostoma lanceolatum TaxID=7740 RepID=A0A8J9ZNU0_BRALA|nr:SERGEF [Branchiostoma lanceolatum]